MNCQVELPVGPDPANNERCGTYAIHRCEDCGTVLCREHEQLCCGVYWCAFCLPVHNEGIEHESHEEVFRAA